MTNINVFKEIKIGSHIRQEINAGGKFVVYRCESIIVNFKGGKDLTPRCWRFCQSSRKPHNDEN